MTIKQLGGIFGRNPTFNDVTIEGQLTFEGNLDINSDITWEDNKKALFGDDGDLQIYHTGTQNYIEDAGSGNLNFKSNGNNFNFLDGSDSIVMQIDLNSETTLYHNTNAKLTTTSTGVTVTGTVVETSDRNEKQDIEALSDAERRVAVVAKGLLCKFRWKADVEERGDSADIHFGIIAQDLQSAFEAEGLDAGRYGIVNSEILIDEDTGEERTRLGVRYSELLAFIISAI